MTRTSYDDYGVTAGTAQPWQKHPRAIGRAMRNRWTKYISRWDNAPDISDMLLSASTVVNTAPVSTLVGNLSLTLGAGKTETYVYSLTSNPGALFKIAAGNQLQVNAALTAGAKPITVKAVGQTSGKTFSKNFNITVT